MTLAAGTLLGPYEIVGLIGAGGMGEVYRALDPRLSRIVAIKILPPSFAADPDRLRRFEHEARAIAALNHPNVIVVHDVGVFETTPYLVMEWLDGQTLRDAITTGVSLTRAVDYAIQIAEGLAAAHTHGILHRDLKPENVFITRPGRAKILDFGLAKATRPASRGAVTETVPAWQHESAPGTVVGTIGYVSPEHVLGKPIDHRSDLFSFGVLLFEMLVRRAPFKRDSAIETLHAIVRDEPPDIRGLDVRVPPALCDIVGRCLAKEPEKRFQSASDLAFSLRAMSLQAGLASVRKERAGLSWPVAAAAALALCVAGGLVGWSMNAPRHGVPAPPVRTMLGLSPADEFRRPSRTDVALSPDGRLLVFGAFRGGTRALYLHALDQLENRALAGTEGAQGPFFSPDGEWVAFWTGTRLQKISLESGLTTTICQIDMDIGASGATWAASNAIVFSQAAEGLWQVPASGGTPTRLTTVDAQRGERSHLLPQVLPGGEHVIFTVRSFGAWDEARIVLQPMAGGTARTLITGGADARYIAGHLVFMRAGTLMAVPFDLSELNTSGEAFPVTTNVMQSIGMRAPNENIGAGQFTISQNGTLVYVTGGIRIPDVRSLVWVDRRGNVEPVAAPHREYVSPRLSSDGRRVAVSARVTGGAGQDIWIYDLARETSTRLTLRHDNTYPIWSPDGKRIVFGSDPNGYPNLFRMPADGSGSPERMTTLAAVGSRQDPSAWSPDGTEIAFTERRLGTRTIWILPPGGGAAPRRLLEPSARYEYRAPDFSPDGRWLAYSSNESGIFEVFVQRYPDGGERHQISTGGGIEPLWSRNGRELFYRNGPHVMAVDISTSPAFHAGQVRRLFEGPYFQIAPSRHYDISSDGQRFLMVLPVDSKQEQTPRSLTVVLNWFADLQRRAPSS